jgi:hypothetical protein
MHPARFVLSRFVLENGHRADRIAGAKIELKPDCPT